MIKSRELPSPIPVNPYSYVDREAEAAGGISGLGILLRDGMQRFRSDFLESSDSKLRLIEHQRALAVKMGIIIGSVIRGEYPGVHPIGKDIGSFSRATNLDARPDIDLMFVGVPKKGGFVDWTNMDTHTLAGTWDGIVAIEDIIPLTGDSHLANVVKRCLTRLEATFVNPRFNWVRSWDDFPGVVFNISVEDREYGLLDYDINLYHEDEYFGIEHASRFKYVIDAIRLRDGVVTAWQILENIKFLKGQLRAKAVTTNGKIDKTLKVPGFVVESIFALHAKPINHEVMMKTILANQLTPTEVNALPNAIQNITRQFMLEPETSIRDILLAMTKGGYKTLLEVASKT